MVDLTIVDSLLGVPPGYASWRAAHIARRAGLLPTWLSSMVAQDRPIGPVAREYLERVRRSVAILHAAGEKLSAAHGASVIKGPRIAAHYPAGLLRQSGDTDLVASDEATLWACVLDLSASHGAVPQGVNLLQSANAVHLVVAMKWPAEEPLLDKPLGADISTCAFSGDTRGVPVRAPVPADDDLCSLFAVAEERFQRPFRAKDLLDLVVLADVLHRRFGDRLTEVVPRLAADLCLAPELRQLIKKTAGWVDLPPAWADVAARLRPLAQEEKARRSTRRDIPRLRFGFPLANASRTAPELRIQPFDRGELAITPLGVCLLVDAPTIPEETYVAAMEAARRL